MIRAFTMLVQVRSKSSYGQATTISEKRDNDNNDMYQNYFKRLCTLLTCAFISPNNLRQFCHIVTGKDWSKVNSAASLNAPSGYDSEPHRVLPALGI